jgi:hypothetical protein
MEGQWYSSINILTVLMYLQACISVWLYIFYIDYFTFAFSACITNSVATEPEGSSPCSQQPATSPYPEPAESTPHPLPANLPKINSDPIRLRLRLPNGLFPSGFPIKTLYTFLSHACHMPRLPHPPRFDLRNNICGGLQNMKLLIMQIPPFSSYFTFLGPNTLLRTVSNTLNLCSLHKQKLSKVLEVCWLLGSYRLLETSCTGLRCFTSLVMIFTRFKMEYIYTNVMKLTCYIWQAQSRRVTDVIRKQGTQALAYNLFFFALFWNPRWLVRIVNSHSHIFQWQSIWVYQTQISDSLHSR